MPSPFHKLKAKTAGGSMSMTVSKTGGPVVTRAVVGSTGTDDATFDDAGLTPGPATMPLLPKNSYSIVWLGAFVADGTAVLDVVVNHADGRPPSNLPPVKVKGKSGDSFFRVVLVP